MEELVLHVGMFPWKLSSHVIGFALKDLLYTIAALMLLFCFIIHVIAVLRRDGFLFSDWLESLLFTVREENAVKSNTWAQFKAYKEGSKEGSLYLRVRSSRWFPLSMTHITTACSTGLLRCN